MSEPQQWASFVATLTAEHLAHPRRIMLPRFTQQHPRDDVSACPAGAARAFVCLGCARPRILMENERCGKCEMHATTPIDEYVETTAVPSAAFYVVDHSGAEREARGVWEAFA